MPYWWLEVTEMATNDEKELWVQWTHDAMLKYTMPDEVKDADEMADDMADVTTKYADQMLDEYKERFGGAATRAGRRRSKPTEEPEGAEEEGD